MPTYEVAHVREKFRSKPRTRPSQWSRLASNAAAKGGKIKVAEVAPADRVRVITRLDKMRSMPYANHKAKVDVAGTVVELTIDPIFGPVVYRGDGRIERLELNGVGKVGSGSGKFGLDHGFGAINKPWFEMTITEQEAALVIAAKKNHKLKTWYDATDKEVWDDHHGYEIKAPGVEEGWIAFRRICGAVFPGVTDKLWIPGSQQSYFDDKMKELIENGLVLDPSEAVPLEDEAPQNPALPAAPAAAIGSGTSAASGDRAAATAMLWERESIMDDPGRKYDIVVYGAAGYVGQLCARQLDAFLSEGGTPQSWALAGRDEEQLKSIASKCQNKPGVIKVGDLTAISKMCRDTRVLVTLAGPYARNGEDVVSCCVNQCTDYIDASTEAVWIKRMVDRYHARAREKGVMLVFSAGQESATYDTMAYKLTRKLGPLSTLRTYMLRYGKSSGGHLLTGQLVLQHMASESKYAETFHDPCSLSGKGASALPGDTAEPVVEDAFFPGLWSFPLPDTTQVRIMRRTCALFGASATGGVNYGQDLLAFPVRDAAAKRKVAELSLAAPMPQTQDEAKRLWDESKGSLSEQVAKGTAPPAGRGPSEGARGLYFSECYMVAEGENGEWAHVHHTAPDACEVTAICCASGALVLLQEQDAIRPKTRGGCVTPAYAFHGSTWADRCEAAVPAGTSHQSMVYEVLEGKPATADLAAVIKMRARRAVEAETAIAKGAVRAFG